jgi:uncharacterized protein (DUF427 family)
MIVEREQTRPGQESVWDYPRPPRVERFDGTLRIVFAGQEIVKTERAFRVLETSHPPNYYIPREDIAAGVLEPVEGSSFCGWKGIAHYFTVRQGESVAVKAAWGYADPVSAFRVIKDHVAFYAGPMDACYVNDEMVVPQPGGFYGGWITSHVAGPFKGEPGTMFW